MSDGSCRVVGLLSVLRYQQNIRGWTALRYRRLSCSRDQACATLDPALHMPVDLEYLREHYASLSDEALLEIDREELVKAAQECYDDELGRRELTSGRGVRRADAQQGVPRPPYQADGKSEVDHEAPGESERPDWLEEAAEVYSRVDLSGTGPASDVLDARDALETAGISCYLDLFEIPEEKSEFQKPAHRWRLMVPGNLNLHAASVLERDIFNAEFEAEWKTHLETLSDEELLEMTPRAAFCGLFDRVERVTKAYEEEIARRRLRS